MILTRQAKGRVTVEHQYKHGFRDVTLTIPTGTIEEDQYPIIAVQMELQKETRYLSTDWSF